LERLGKGKKIWLWFELNFRKFISVLITYFGLL